MAKSKVVDRSHLSKNPSAVRARIRRGSGKVLEDITVLAETRKPLAEWDFEELAHGRPRDRNGRFTGQQPKWLTPAIRDEAAKRLKSMARQKMSAHVGEAIKVMTDLMKEDGVDLDGKPLVTAAERIKAATFIIEQTVGKATAKVEVEVGDKTRQMLAAAIMLPDGSPMYGAGDVLEGELVTDEEAADDDLHGE